MADWEGLLKFSLSHSDGTHETEFKEMSAENKRWLEEAMLHYCGSQLKRIQQLTADLIPSHPAEQIHSKLEELQDLMDSLDRGSTLYKLGGHLPLLRVIFYHFHSPNRVLALQILAAVNQNDCTVQNQSINCGALQLVETITHQSQPKVREAILSLISAIIRGQNLEAKRIFIRIGGLQLIKTLLHNETNINNTVFNNSCIQGTQSEKIINKAHNLLRDLLFYDDRLHLSFNDVGHFSNTADLSGLKREHNTDLTYDPNRVQAQQNQLPCNLEYKGSVRRFVEAEENRKMLKNYLDWLKLQQ